MSSSGRRRTIGIFVLLILVGPFLVDWMITTEEERVEAVVEVALDAVARKDAGALAALFSPEFEDDTGLLRRLSREGAEVAIESAWEPLDSMEMGEVEVDVEVDGDAATLDLTALVAGAPWMRRRISLRVVMRADLALQEDDQWRFTRLRSLDFRPD